MLLASLKPSRLVTIIIGFYLLLFNSLLAEEVKLTFAEAKVYFAFYIINQVTWPDEDKFDQFKVGIIGDDSDLDKAFQQKMVTKIRGKSFVFEHINLTDFSSTNYALIFITDKKRSHNNDVFLQTKNSLIITDGPVDNNQQLFSLISKSDNIKIDLNRNNLSARGFVISNELLLLAGTKEELGEQLNDREKVLKALMEEVQQKEIKLNALNNTLNAKTEILNAATKKLEINNRTLSQNRKQLDALTNEIHLSELEQAEIKQDITHQNEIIQQKLNKINAQEKLIFDFQSNIQHNKTVLEKQIIQIEKQNEIIQNKTNIITEQRGWMFAILLVSIVFFIMIYFLLRSNRLRKSANKDLALLNSELHKLATTDGMTKLFNRRHFLETAQKELIRQQRNLFQSAILMIDIDSFKRINDTYGHIVGDSVIVSVANSLKSNMRQYDLVGRFGGEEYAMMLVNCDIKLATEIAQRICDEIAEHKIVYENFSFNISISVGLSQLIQQDKEVLQTLVRADKALYQAKQTGKNKVVVFP